MANRGGSSGRPGDGASRGAATQGRRPTKAERKEDARRQRIELHRKMAAKRRNRWIALVVAVAVLGAGVAVYALTRPKSKSFSGDRLLAQAAAAAKAASCQAVKDVGPYQPESLDRAHIGAQGGPAQMPQLSSYPSVPPASGPHDPTPLDAGVYDTPPPIGMAIHSLEHASVEIWYAPDATGQQLADIRSFFGKSANNDHVIVAPYSYPDQGAAGSLPAGVQMALVAWHHVELCGKPSLAVAFDFASHYRFPPLGGESYKGDAPEQGVPI